MRALLLLAAVAGVSLGALLDTRLALYGYIGFSLLRPDELAWSTQQPYSFTLAVVTLASSFRHFGSFAAPLRSPIVHGLLLLQLPVALSVALALSPSASLVPYLGYLRIILIASLIPVLVKTENDLRRLLLIMAISFGLLAMKFALYGGLHPGVHFERGFAGMLSDNNDLALAFAMTIPLCWYGRAMVSKRLLKAVLLVMAGSMGAAIIMTNSRGGTLSLTVALISIVRRTKQKFLTALALPLVVALSLLIGGDSYVRRMSTLTRPGADSSSFGRLHAASEAMRVWKEYPWIGVGFGGAEFRWLESPLRSGWRPVVHNTYLEMLVDSGVFAFAAYVFLLGGTILWLGHSAKVARKLSPGKEVYPLSLQAALITFAMGSTFLSRIGFDYFYFLLTSAASWQLIQRQALHSRAEEEIAEQEPQAALGCSRPALGATALR